MDRVKCDAKMMMRAKKKAKDSKPKQKPNLTCIAVHSSCGDKLSNIFLWFLWFSQSTSSYLNHVTCPLTVSNCLSFFKIVFFSLFHFSNRHMHSFSCHHRPTRHSDSTIRQKKKNRFASSSFNWNFECRYTTIGLNDVVRLHTVPHRRNRTIAFPHRPCNFQMKCVISLDFVFFF